MTIKDAFNQTLNRYGLTARKLAERTGISDNHLSAFRRGASSIGSEKLETLIEAMDELAPGSKQYFYLQLAGSPLKPIKSAEWRSLIMSATYDEIEEILYFAADRWTDFQKQRRESSKSADENSVAAVL